MADSGEEFPRLIHNGNGPQVGRDLNGNVIYKQQLDAKSSAALKQVSKDMPALSRLLEDALRDGLISPDLVNALQSALNEDVLHVLTVVGQHISEDVAMEFSAAGETIKEVVTVDFPAVSRELSDRVDEIKTATESLSIMLGQGGAHAGTVSRTAGIAIQPAPRSTEKWPFRIKLTCVSAGVGLLGAVMLMRSHVGGYAVFAGVCVLLFAALLQFGNRR